MEKDICRDEEHRANEKEFNGILKDYLKYEGDKMSLEDWTETSIKKISHLREVDERNEFYLLAQAHICILGNRMDEAKWLLESYNYNRFAIGKDVELSSYYLYLTTKLSNASQAHSVFHCRFYILNQPQSAYKESASCPDAS